MRKILAIVITLCLLLTFVGCQNKNDGNDLIDDYSSSDTSSVDNTSSGSSVDNTSSDKTNTSSSKNPNSNPNLPRNTLQISYNVNSKEVLKTTFSTEFWGMPFAREDDGRFTRDGYVLLGYSFDKDGKGELIRPGHKYSVPSKDKVLNLHCVWAKETSSSSFKTVAKTDNTVYITGYTGKDKVVYIPRKIGNKTVTGIASGAFSNNKTLSEVHITSSITRVEANAFANCSNLKKVTLYDNLKLISNDSFKGSPVKTVRICAAKTPRHITSDETYGIKYERLIKTKGEKRIIVVAGSSALFGIDSDYMENQFQDDYTVINFGTNANMNILFFLEAIIPHLTKDDIVVFAPEQYGPFAYHTNGNPEFTNVTLQGIASCYNLLENIDVSLYTDVFNSIMQYCAITDNMPELAWDNYGDELNKLGDLAKLTDKMNSPTYRNAANGEFRFDSTVIPAEYISNLNRVIDKTSKSGAKIFFSYPPHNKNNVKASHLNSATYTSYNNWIAKTVKCPLISDVRNYIYNGEYFANTDYHLNAVGRKLHTKQLAQDIINAGIGVK